MIAIHTLGSAVISIDGHKLKPTSSKKFASLLYLSAERGRHVSRLLLQELLFPELPEPNARHALRELVYQLKQLGAPLVTDKSSVGLPNDVVVRDYDDVINAERLSGDHVQDMARGFLPEYAPDHSESFSEWIDVFRSEQVIALSRRVLRELNERRTLGDWEAVESLARACLGLDPLNELATIALAQALALSGAHSQASALLKKYQSDTGTTDSESLPISELRRRIREAPTGRPPSSRFIGRPNDIAWLSSVLNDSANEVRFAAVIGEPGIGKSRLAEQAAVIAKLSGWTVAHVGLSPGDESRPMWAVAELLPKVMELPGALGCKPESMQWLRRLLATPSAQSIANDDSPHESIAFAISNAAADLIEAVAAEIRLLVVLNDIQWLDSASARFFARLTRNGEAGGLVIIATGRNDDRLCLDQFRGGSVSTRRLPPLNHDECGLMAREQLAASIDGDLHEWLVEASAGNPFFLECLIRHVRDTGERFAIPRRLAEFVDQQVRGLSEQHGQVLLVATLLGKTSTVGRLCRVLDLTPTEALAALKSLNRAGFVVNDGSIEPRHSLIAESVIRLAEPVACRLVHHRIANLLRQEVTENGDPTLMWALSEHMIAAGENGACAALAECARHTLSIGRARDAGELYLRAAQLALGRPAMGRYLEEAIRAAIVSNEADVVRIACEALRETTTIIPDDIYLYSLLARMACEETIEHELGQVRAFFNDTTRDTSLRAKAAHLFSVACDQDERYDLLAECADEIIRVAESPELDAIASLRLRVVLSATAGDRSKSPELARELLVRIKGHPAQTALNSQRQAAIALTRAGLYEESTAAFINAYRSAVSLGLYRTEQHIALMLAGMYNDVGDFETGDVWLNRAKEKDWGDAADREGFLRLAITSDRALRMGDWLALAAIARKATGFRGPSWVRRVRRWATSLEVVERFLAGEVQQAAAITATVIDSNQSYREAGESGDFCAAVAARILMEQGQPVEAAGLVNRYLCFHRHPHMPLLSSLRDVVMRLRITRD